jgi:hypothetical protein
MWDRIIIVCKSVLGEILDGINRQRRNVLLQWEGTLQSMQFHQLWRGPNGPLEIFQAITAVQAVLEHRANGQDASNGHIASSWKSANLHCSDIPTKFQFFKPSFCKVLHGTSCNFSNFNFFFLSFLSFFPVI